jgi:hypothetical protein
MSRADPVELAPVQLAPPEVLARAVCDGSRLGLQLSYIEGAGAALKRAGASWFAPRRMWVVPAAPAATVFAWLVSALDGHSFDRDSAATMLRQTEGVADPTFFSQLLDVQLFPLQAGAGLAVSSLYDPFVIRAMKSLGGRFHSYAQAWQVRVPLEQVMQALSVTAGVAGEFVFCHETPVVLETLTSPPKSLAPIKVLAASPPGSSTGQGSEEDEQGAGFLTALMEQSERLPVDRLVLTEHMASAGLRDYQEAGVLHLVTQSGACLGDDMGLGKSRQTVVASAFVAAMEDDGSTLASQPGRVLILCPATLRVNWEREIRAVYPDAVIGMVGEDRMTTLYGCGWVIANYERLGGLVKETGLTFKVLAADEAHYLKEHDSGRTRNTFIMGSRIPRRFLVTGTPLLNKEIELHTLLRLTGHRLGLMELKEFRKQYAGGTAQREALASALKGWLLRRSKGVLTELGSKERQVRWIAPAEGLKPYQELMADMSLSVMPKLVKLRQCLEAMKVDFLIETVESLSEGDKIIVFAEYMSTVDSLKSAFERAGIKAVSLVGADPPKKRQAAIDSFQRDPDITVFIGTRSAAGVGITLTAANYVAFASPPWTPALMRQAEDRAYRLGQTRNVFVLMPLIPNTIDMQIWDLLGSKTQLEQDVVEASVVAQLH